MNRQQNHPQQRRGNRFSSLMLIAGAFLIVDMLILLYFFWPGKNSTQPEQHGKPAVEQQTKSAPLISPDNSRE